MAKGDDAPRLGEALRSSTEISWVSGTAHRDDVKRQPDSLGDSVLHESFNDAGAANLMIESIVLPQRTSSSRLFPQHCLGLQVEVGGGDEGRRVSRPAG